MTDQDREVLHKEIDLIQSCISRMAHNSFMVKGWTIAIVSVALAVLGEASFKSPLAAVLLIPLLCLWWLDAFFLRVERMYRELYSWVLDQRAKGSLDKLYDLNPNRFRDNVASHLGVGFSITLRWFYGLPTLAVLTLVVWQFAASPRAAESDLNSTCECADIVVDEGAIRNDE